MQIILLEKVSKLGIAGETVNVKPGYARNFLIPTKKALRATDENRQYFETKKKDLQEENKKKIEEAKKSSNTIDGKFIVLIRQAGEDGRLFGSVSARDIAEAVTSTTKTEVAKNQVILNDAVKYLGVYETEIALHAEVVVKVKLNIARSETEAEIAKKKFLNPPKKEENIEEVYFAKGKKKADEEQESELSEEVQTEDGNITD